ncbi:putative transporter slc-17.3 [Aphelenchoides bicaudatus]|nr:putative transporter slc-17.3 [Aphelenchoides bicaudatus]
MKKPTEMERMTQIKTIPFFHPLSRRMHVIVVLMIGCFCMAYTRSNLGMAITCMVNSSSTAIKLQQTQPSIATLALEREALRCTNANLDKINTTKEIPVNNYGGEIDWDSKTQNIIFTGTFWGSLLSALPADRTSAINLLLFASLVLSLTSTLFPYFALNYNYYAVFILRFITGIGEGLMLPAVNSIIGRWIPNTEKSQAVSLFTLGAQMSGAVGVPISASFCASRFRWPGIFYFLSIFILVWALLLRLTTTNSPAKAKCMTRTERNYLEQSLENHRPINKEPHTVPWRAMLTSMPVLACLFVSFTFNTLMVLIHSYQPTYFKEVLYLKMMDNGIYSSLPHIGQMSIKMVWATGIDYLKQRKIVSNTAGCRISQGFASVIAFFMLLLIAFVADCTRPKLALIFSGLGTATSGFYTSMVTLAPAHVGTLSSLSMLVGFIGMLFTPMLVGMFRTYGTADEWFYIFVVISFLVGSSGIFFSYFGSGEVQEWGRRKTTVQGFINVKEDPLLKFEAKPDAVLIESALE